MATSTPAAVSKCAPRPEAARTTWRRSISALRSKNHLDQAEQAVEEIVYVLASNEPFLVRFGMAYLEIVANPVKLLGLAFQCCPEFGGG